jgi:hypothetical protein
MASRQDRRHLGRAFPDTPRRSFLPRPGADRWESARDSAPAQERGAGRLARPCARNFRGTRQGLGPAEFGAHTTMRLGLELWAGMASFLGRRVLVPRGKNPTRAMKTYQGLFFQEGQTGETFRPARSTSFRRSRSSAAPGARTDRFGPGCVPWFVDPVLRREGRRQRRVLAVDLNPRG